MEWVTVHYVYNKPTRRRDTQWNLGDMLIQSVANEDVANYGKETFFAATDVTQFRDFIIGRRFCHKCRVKISRV